MAATTTKGFIDGIKVHYGRLVEVTQQEGRKAKALQKPTRQSQPRHGKIACSNRWRFPEANESEQSVQLFASDWRVQRGQHLANTLKTSIKSGLPTQIRFTTLRGFRMIVTFWGESPGGWHGLPGRHVLTGRCGAHSKRHGEY
jgi:hypothetical protein